MKTALRNLFRKIFHEAQVIDFDLSFWDKRVRLVVLASLDTSVPPAAYNVDFRRQKDLLWHSNHLHVQLPPGEHCEWHIMDAILKREGNGWSAEFRGIAPAPDVVIRFEELWIEEFDARQIKSAFPALGEPGGPLVRPPLDRLIGRTRSIA